MRLQKAIERLTEIPPWPNENDDPCYLAALKLLIEAGKRLQELRIDNPETVWQLLPGETAE